MGRASVETTTGPDRGRDAFAGRRWADAFDALAAADATGALDGDDLVLLAWSAHLTGRHDDFVAAMERAHHGWLGAGDVLAAARCATAMGAVLASRGELAAATGWYGRAARLVERHGGDCAERGHLLVLALLRQATADDWEAVRATAVEMAGIGERFDDADLAAFAAHWQGRALVRLGHAEDGLRLLDEAMVAVTADEVSPHVAGTLYCSTIETCQEIWALDRSHEWTTALARWCDERPDLLPFTGQCLVHRSELLTLRGAWPDALAEAVRAGDRIGRGVDVLAAGAAHYQQGEVHRLRGDVAAAEAAYRAAADAGREPQPGLALLRLAQGDVETAVASVHRVLVETDGELARTRLLPAAVEILVAAGDIEEAQRACLELERTAEHHPSGLLGALASGARGMVELAVGHPADALTSLRVAGRAWQQLDAPYETARLRVLIGRACRALGDHDAAALEVDAARRVFERLGARPDLEHLDAAEDRPVAGDGGLTARELEVLRLVSTGRTNRAIATELAVSVKTVERHVSSILTKLGVESRTAAATHAHRRRLLRPSASTPPGRDRRPDGGP